MQHYILVVQAQDAGHPALSSTLTVYCNVLDLNDNAPLFDLMSYSNEIFENVSISTPVGSVSATDLDSGKVDAWILQKLPSLPRYVEKKLKSLTFLRRNASRNSSVQDFSETASSCAGALPRAYKETP